MQPETSPQQPPGARPVDESSRIAAIDVARGIALLGILLINIRLFSGPWMFDLLSGTEPWTGVDRVTAFITTALAETKMVSIFSLLFGVGLGLLYDRLRRDGASPWPVLVRRLLVLGVVGALHAVLLWTGDILFLYALSGLLALLFIGRNPRTIVTWGCIGIGLVALFGVFSVLGGLFTLGMDPETAIGSDPITRLGQQLSESALAAYGDGSYGDQVAQRLAEIPFVAAQLIFFVPLTLGLMLLGAAAWRSGLIHQIPTDPTTVRRIARWGLGVGLPINVLAATFSAVSSSAMAGWGVVGQGLILMGGPLLGIGYLATIALAYLRRPDRPLFARLAATGRMAFTNYLAQSVICVAVFAGLGVYGQWSLTASMGVVAVVWALQLIWSPLWLARFRMGPLEWAWRAATYLTLPPFRRT